MDDPLEGDQLFSQVLLPEDFELEPLTTNTVIVNDGSGSTSETYAELTCADARPSSQRFGPFVTESHKSAGHYSL